MKKIIALVLVLVTSAFVMIGCSKSGSGDDPYSIAKALDNSSREVEIGVDQDDIAEFGRAFSMSTNGIYCIVYVEDENYENRRGYFFFCDDDNAIDRLYSDFERHLNYNYDIYTLEGAMLEKKGSTIFLGSDTYFNEIYR